MTDDAGQPPRYLENILVLTAFASGTVDIISFTKLGGSLASAMTGNLAFLGLYFARGSLRAAIGAASALAGFIAGGVLASLLSRNITCNRSLRRLFGAEVLLLAVFFVLWFLIPHHKTGLNTDILIMSLAVAMGVQSIAGKKINLSNIPTVVFTSTLTNIVVGLTGMLASGRPQFPSDTRRQLASFSAYFLGALSAGFLLALNVSALTALPLTALTICWALAVTFRSAAA